MECRSCAKYENIPENNEIFICGFKLNKTNNIDNFLLSRCESDKLCENDKLFDFWSNKFTNKELAMTNFILTG